MPDARPESQPESQPDRRSASQRRRRPQHERQQRLAADLDRWERLLRLHRLAVREMDGHLRATFGHPLDDYDVLHQVAIHDGPIRMGELAERLVLAKSSCHRIVGRLVEAGHLERGGGRGDRREVLVSLTATGRRLHRRMAAVHSRDIERHLGSLSDAGRAGLDRALGELDASPG